MKRRRLLHAAGLAVAACAGAHATAAPAPAAPGSGPGPGAGPAPPAALPIFDSHLHYSHDAWDVLPPRDAVAILRAAGLKSAMVSSSSDDGTQKLFAAAPDLVIPVLRPYRQRGEIGTWVRDASIVAHLESRLARHAYAALGEYHVFGEEADLPVMRRVLAMAKERRLFLHSHSDADAVERQFRQDPDARILWAHAGFDPPEAVRAMLRRHPRLWCDLAFRSDHASGGRVDAAWREAFLEFPDRFTLGTDTFTPERWHFVVEHANHARRWLAELPPAVAEAIAWKTGDTLFGVPWRAGRR